MRYFLSFLLLLSISFFVEAQENEEPVSGHVFELLDNDSLSPLPGCLLYTSDAADE